MRFILSALLLSSCTSPLAPEHSRERSIHLGLNLVSFVERIEARAPAPPEIPKGPHYYQK